MLHIRSILHPTDFSPSAEYPWHVACALARDHGARLMLLHVHALPTVPYGEFGMLPADDVDQETLEAQLAAIEPTDPSLAVSRFVVQGDEAEEILRFAQDNDCDMIVMGSHGRKGLGRLFMGSVAERVVRKAECPVLVVKHPMAQIGVGARSGDVEVGAAI